MKVLILLSILAMAFAKRKRCGTNECYSECGTSCPLTCENYLDPPKACTADCRIGCQCKKGFVRSCDGLCVRPEDCPDKKCGENERYTDCGTTCPLTCENFEDPPKMCTMMCFIGCECKDGFVKSSDGRCIRPEECHKCGKNERYTDCGTSCPLTCENFHDPPKICNMMCFIGCECEDGFVKSRDGRCIRPEECHVCGRNEQYNDCGTSCPLTCENYRNPPKFCTHHCVAGCECKMGYVRSLDGLCVLPINCPVIDPVPQPKNCYEPLDPGPCFGSTLRFYYDTRDHRCKGFIYRGCGGNGNRYDTEEECISHCGVHSTPDRCQEEQDVGPCAAVIPRFFFNKDSGKCEEFSYGGCGGNSNNFANQKECESVCCSG